MTNNPQLTIEPFALRPREAAKYAGICLTTFWARVHDGLYESFYDGRKRLVTVESIKRHQEELLAKSKAAPNTKPARRLGPGPGRPRKSDT